VSDVHKGRSRHDLAPVQPFTVRLIAAHEDERRRIARELHDDISQRLALLAVELEQLALTAPGDSLRRRWRELSQSAGDIASDLHRISHSLHPARLETLGLVAAIAGFCQELWTRQQLRVRFIHEGVPRVVPPETALALYRIVQEALHNVVKHSGVAEAEVSLICRGRELLLRVTDLGSGFLSAPAPGVGLASMRERIHAIGGTLSLQSTPGRGTRVTVKVEMPNAPGDAHS
jgi:signal transduction histidine kinase